MSSQDARGSADETCIDCDRPMVECSCEGVLRCSCGIPDVVCVCAAGPAGQVRRYEANLRGLADD